MSHGTQPPSGRILSLLTTLSNPSDHDTHAAALSARDAALSSSSESYGLVCLDLARVLASPSPYVLPKEELDQWITHSGGMNAVQLYCSSEQGWSQLREMAGLLLKNALVNPPWDMTGPQAQALASQPHLRKRMRLPPPSSDEIKQILLHTMTDCNTHVRKVSSTIIAACTVQRPIFKTSLHRRVSDNDITVIQHPPLPLQEWTDLPHFLAFCLENGVRLYGESIYSSMNGDVAAQQEKEKIQYALQGALQTLSKMLEDDPVKVEQDLGVLSFQKIVAAFISILQSPRVLEKHSITQLGDLSQVVKNIERVKIYALECCIFLVGTMPSNLVALMDQFLGVLSLLSSDPLADVRKLVCRAIVSLLKSRAEFVSPHIISISEFILQATTDPNNDVALEACEFWLSFASLDSDTCSPEMSEAVKNLLPRLIPVLVKGMVYPPEKIEELIEMNELDERQGDDHAKDIAPIFHKQRIKGGVTASQSSIDRDDEDSNEDDGDDIDDIFDERDWNLRTCSAAALDTLSVAYTTQDILPYLLPVLQESLGHTNPWICEAGVLALGAVSSGCYQQLGSHMPQLHPFLMGHLTSANALPQLRSICIWTLSRYADWISGQVASGLQPDLLGRLVESLLVCVSSNNRRVQLAACSAISDIVERLPELMDPYVDALFDSFSQALLKYQTRSLLVLLDTIGTIADFIGPSIWAGSSIHRCLSSMTLIWGQRALKNPFDRTLLSLMESLASIAVTGGVNIQPIALECFENAMATIEFCSVSLASMDYDADDADPIVCATDLLDGLVEGLGNTFSNLILSSRKYGCTFSNVLKSLISHEVSAVRMSGFALMGDLAKHSPLTIHGGIKELIQETIYNIDPSYPLVCNNAAWALGEVCVKCIGNPLILDPFADDIVQNLIVVLMSSRDIEMENESLAAASLAENAASTLGRLAMVNPSFVAKDLPRCLIGWCDGMSKIYDLAERKDAFKGFIEAVRLRPHCVLEASVQVSDVVTSILLAVVSWHIPDRSIATASMLHGKYNFREFPSECRDLVDDIISLLQLIMPLVGWENIKADVPVNVKVLLRDVYKLN